jgi:hypothetical protein
MDDRRKIIDPLLQLARDRWCNQTIAFCNNTMAPIRTLATLLFSLGAASAFNPGKPAVTKPSR